jgi:outer membrane immunogenic protein
VVTRALLATAAAIMLAAAGQPVVAADFGENAAPIPFVAPPAAHNWTGFYAGGNTASSRNRPDLDYSFGALSAGSAVLDPNSFVAGGQIGYNWQFGSFVIGVEGDLAWRHGTDLATVTPNNAFGEVAGFNTQQNWVGTVRPRVGFAANNWLIYGTGGLAFGGVRHGFGDGQPALVTRGPGDSDAKTGWTAGGGVEYAFTNHWSLGVEYLYMDFGSSALSQPVPGVPTPSAGFDDKSHVVRAKVHYKLDWTTPILGR